MDYKPQIETVLHYINTQIQHNWLNETNKTFSQATNIDKLSKIACLSKRNFQLIFKSYMKESVGQYVDRLRLEYGLLLLKENRYSQKEIAERTGWANDTAFYNAFRKKYSQPPAKYKSNAFGAYANSDFGKVEYTLIDLDETPIIFFLYQGSYTDYASKIFEEESWDTLYKYAASNNILPEKEEYWGICYDDCYITLDEKCRFYAGLTVKSMPKLKITDKIKTMILPKAKYAVYLHKGPYSKLDSFYNTILQQIPDSYNLGDGVILEKYLNSRTETSENELLTEVMLPITNSF